MEEQKAKDNEIKSQRRQMKKNKKTIIATIIMTIIFIIPSIFIGYILGASASAVLNPSMNYKPVIYLYPTTEQKITVELGREENLTCSYPKYINGWNVIAKPNGDLTDEETRRNLYSLYYESINEVKFKMEGEGFIVKSEEVAEFLEEKLEILGLNEREAEEFIIYWLPKLETNKYNYIRFVSLDEINKNMPLEIKPNPDTIIRVMMTFKGLDKPIEVKEQELTTPERKGFVAVEWGGTEIK